MSTLEAQIGNLEAQTVGGSSDYAPLPRKVYLTKTELQQSL